MDTLKNWIRQESYNKGFSKEDAFIGEIRLHNVLINQIPAGMLALGHNQQSVRKELLRMIDYEEFAEELAKESKRRRWARGVRGTATGNTIGVETNTWLEGWIRTESSRAAFSKEGVFIGEIRLHNVLINSITASMTAQGYTPQSVRRSLLKLIDEGFSKELRKESHQRMSEGNYSFPPNDNFDPVPQPRVMPEEIMDAEFPPLGKESFSTTPSTPERTSQNTQHIHSYRAVLASVQKKTAEATDKETELSFRGAFDENSGEDSGGGSRWYSGKAIGKTDENSGENSGGGSGYSGRNPGGGSGWYSGKAMGETDENSGKNSGGGSGYSGKAIGKTDEDSGGSSGWYSGKAMGETDENSGKNSGGGSGWYSGKAMGETDENSGRNSGRGSGWYSGKAVGETDETFGENSGWGSGWGSGKAIGKTDETPGENSGGVSGGVPGGVPGRSSGKAIGETDETVDDSGETVGAKRLKALKFPFCIQHAILAKIQAVLETAFFKYSQTNCPSILARKGWNCSHAGELNAWTKEFRTSSDRGELSGAIVDNPVRLLEILEELDYLRDTAVHRIPIREERLTELVRFALDAMGLLEDKQGAAEVGEIAGVIKMCTQHCIDSMDKLSQELDQELQLLDIERRKLEEKESQIREKAEGAMKEVENSMERVFVDQLQALGLQSHYVGLG